MRDAKGDVIKRAAVVTEMVASIAEIPDNIQRSMFIAECARTMEVDAALLTAEVARKRLAGSTADGEQREFVRRQEAIRRAEDAALVVPLGHTAIGSSIEELEKELIKYLIKYGHEMFDFRDGRAITPLNVASTIIGEIQANDITLRNPRLKALYDTYAALRDESGEGVEILAHHFITHPDPEVCNVAVDLLTADDIYTLSKLWKRHDFSDAGERDRLGEALPRAVILYKSKVIEEMSTMLRARLDNPELSDTDSADILRQLTALGRERTAISRRLSRLIL
jgi:DNA primase